MAGHTDNRITIAAPPGLTWEIVNDLRQWTRLFRDEYAAIEILADEPTRKRFRLTTEPRDGVVHSWTSERCLDPERRTVTARRIDTGPFRYVHIFQCVTSDGADGSVLRWVQDFETGPGSPLSDDQFVARINAATAVNMGRHKEVVEQAAAAALLAKGI